MQVAGIRVTTGRLKVKINKTLCLLSIAVVTQLVLPYAALGKDHPNTVSPYGFDLDGHPIHQLTSPTTRAVVLIFAATDCPVSNRYIPEIKRLDQQLSKEGVVFWWVFPNPRDTASIVRKHELDYSITTKTAIDSQQDLVRLAHAAVTPEAALFSVDHGALHEVYHGRIDDRYIAFGTERPQATHHDLEDAIKAALSGKPIPKPTGGPVGCSIIPLLPIS